MVSSDTMLIEFMAYTAEWKRLAAEYDRIPSWRWIKQQRNITQRSRLTKAYTAKMKEWGIA